MASFPVGNVRFGPSPNPHLGPCPEQNIQYEDEIVRLAWKGWQHMLRANDPHEAESIDGDWRMPATRPSLASLHANPHASALRRARLFDEVSDLRRVHGFWPGRISVMMDWTSENRARESARRNALRSAR